MKWHERTTLMVKFFILLGMFIICLDLYAQETIKGYPEQKQDGSWLRQWRQRKEGRPRDSKYGPGDSVFSLVHEGRERIYKVHLPPSYDGQKPIPVVIYIHGGKGDLRAAYMDGIDKYSDKYGFILVIPQGSFEEVSFGRTRYSWNGGRWQGGSCCGNADDIGFISRMIDQLRERFTIDANRIYATGISNGGLMTNRLGCELSEKIAAIATVAPAALISDCHPARPMPVMDIQGTADPCNPPDGSEPRGIFKKSTYKRMTASQVVDAWKKINGCSNNYVDGYCRRGVHCIIYNECQSGAEVELCMVEGMGHAYPSGAQYLSVKIIGSVSYDISFDQIWEFFKRNPRE